MKIPLSSRLLACSSFIKNGDRVADIGCDHGYLGIYLLEQKIASCVIAADINPMPLQCAKNNAAKYGYTDKMSFYLSDGVKTVPQDFDSMICAGMGADTIISILDNAPWLKSEKYRLILQCQSKTQMLRQFLSAQGWYINQESILRDGRFLYTVMEVIWKPDAPRLTMAQCYLSPALLSNQTAELKEYYKWLLNGLSIKADHKTDPALDQVITELNSLPNKPEYAFLTEDSP